jgi:DNA-binding CsgD family transcriptional regulator
LVDPESSPALTPTPQQVRELLEAGETLAQMGAWQWTPSLGELVWSDNLFRIFSLEPGAIVPTPEYVFAHMHPDDAERVERAVTDMGRTARLMPIEYRILRADGTARHVRATLSTTEERDGQPYRLFGWVVDVTDRHRVRRQVAAHVAVAEALAAWDGSDGGAELLLCGLAGALECVVGTLWAPRDDALVPHTLWRAPGFDAPQFERPRHASRIGRGVGLAGMAWERAQPVTVTADAGLAGGLTSAVAVPALLGDEVLAVVELGSAHAAPYTPDLTWAFKGVAHQLGQFFANRRGELGRPVLTARELEVLQLAAQGLSAPQTAVQLGISRTTVRTHLEHVYEKLGAGDKASAVAAALRRGLIR